MPNSLYPDLAAQGLLNLDRGTAGGFVSPTGAPQPTPQPTTAPMQVNINDPEIAKDVGSFQSAEAQAKYLQGVYEAQKNYLNSVTNPQQSNVLGAQDNQTDDYTQYLQNLLDTQNDLAVYQATNQGYSQPSSQNVQTYKAPQQSQSMPSNYTGYWGGTPYAGGTVQTAGGGFTPEGSYSAGYHGSGGGIGGGPSDIYVNGTVQTRGGGFTPDGSYSAGYHGSGEHPEITGESTPGQYKSGSFGPIIKPDLSNGQKVTEFLRYVSEMGYDVSGVDKASIERQYNQNGGNFDGLAFLQTLPQLNPDKTSLISQYAANPMMPTSQMYSLLGGQGFPNLFAPSGQPQLPGFPRIGGGFFNIQPTQPNQTIVQKVKTLKDLPNAISEQLASTYVNPYTYAGTEDELEKLKLV